jgi:hypothetical protein
MKKKIYASVALLVVGLVAAALYAQTSMNEIEGILFFRRQNPIVRYVGTLYFQDASGTQLSQMDTNGALQHKRKVITASTGTTTLTAAQSGALVANTGTSGTTTFTLPTPAVGLNYCFVEAGDAGGELLVNVGTGVSIVGKTHGAENGSGIATATGTGIKNTAATNVKGDMACVTALSTTAWVMTSVAGVWATQ